MSQGHAPDHRPGDAGLRALVLQHRRGCAAGAHQRPLPLRPVRPPAPRRRPSTQSVDTLLLLLAPMAPHVTRRAVGAPPGPRATTSTRRPGPSADPAMLGRGDGDPGGAGERQAARPGRGAASRRPRRRSSPPPCGSPKGRRASSLAARQAGSSPARPNWSTSSFSAGECPPGGAPPAVSDLAPQEPLQLSRDLVARGQAGELRWPSARLGVVLGLSWRTIAECSWLASMRPWICSRAWRPALWRASVSMRTPGQTGQLVEQGCGRFGVGHAGRRSEGPAPRRPPPVRRRRQRLPRARPGPPRALPRSRAGSPPAWPVRHWWRWR